MAAYSALLSLAQITNPNTTQHESLFSSGAAEKVRSIYNYVISLLWFFEEFPEKVNRWEGRISDLSYEIDTIIESYMWQRIQFGHGLQLKLEDQLENLMERLGLIAGEVTEERPAYVPASSSSSTLATVGNDAVIDLQKDIIMGIQKQLYGEPRKLQVIPITGMGGIGKTTLAKTLYNHQHANLHFDVRAWGVASQDYNPPMLRKNLVDSIILSGKQMFVDEIDESSIILKVHQTLKGRRYLVVLDDVWEKQVWDDVRAMFPDDNNGSRIMLTTRQWDVAIYPGSADPVHGMECLDESQSWDLLRQKVFTDRDCPPELEEVGKEIARRCGGLPLAIVLVAGVLCAANESTQAFWEEIAKNVSRIVGRELEAALSLSYTNLPHHLRSCFLLIGGFQKGLYIRNSRIIRLWAAEGFQRMEERCQKSLEERADEYLEELVKRNLVIVVSRKIDGKIKSCRLHDMVRDMCIKKAHEEKFLHVMDGHDLPQGSDVRRISFNLSFEGTIWAPKLHTILSFQIQNLPCWLELLGNYNLLRELDALGVDLKEFPSQVFKLYHLRYLALKGSFSIPSDASNLVHLQTLIIHHPSGKMPGSYADAVAHSLPLEIWSLPQLRHLFFHAPYVLPHPPQGLIYLPLKNLQTLLLVADLVWNEEILQLIPNVKRLGLTCTSNKEHHLHLLNHLDKLEKLKVIGFPGFTWRRPDFPSKLKKLILVGGEFPWGDMAIVGSLPNLEVLKLRANACDGDTWEMADGGFPSLIFLLIDESNLLKWTIESGSFTKLKRLVLRSCPLLLEIPENIEYIPTLELIEVDNCTESLVDSAKRIKEGQEECGNNDLQVRIGYEREEMEDAELDFLLDNLKDRLLWPSYLITFTEMQKQIESLETDLRLVNAFLKDSSRKPNRDERTKVLVKNIRDVVYEVKDMIKSIKRQSIGAFKFSEPHVGLHEIGKKVVEVREKVEKAKIDFPDLNIHDEDGYDKLEVRPPRQKDVVGFQDVTYELIDRLTQETDYFDVVSLIGKFGLGKTTLAWKIFNDTEIIYKFPVRIWLPISQEFSDKDIFLAILKEFTTVNDELRQKEIMELATIVAGYLERSSFFIVLDDVWSRADWYRLNVAMPANNNKGKILITSRFKIVGIYASYPRPPMKLRFFTQEESWDLLRLEALRKLDCPPELEEFGKMIARDCVELPLAVVVIGGILAAKYSASDLSETRKAWEDVSIWVNTYLNIETDPKESMKKLISLSYDRLPYHLRACFLYLSVFPDDYEISVSRLIWMWIGEGFIQQNNDRRLEEVGEIYLEDLINRNLVTIEKLRPNGKVKTCRIHDALRDFCRNKAENENFLQEIKSNNGGFAPPISDLHKYRRLSIHFNCPKFISQKPLGHRVRTFVCCSKDEFTLQLKDIPHLLSAFRSLRVLEVKPIKLTDISHNMYRLFHARYISMSLDSSTLPSMFGFLWNTQTLIVQTTRRTLDVKADIWKLSRLRHFKTNALAHLPKPSSSSKYGSELQTLETISDESCTAELFERACNLKKLGIRGRLALFLEGKLGSFDSLGKMKYLEKLKLVNDVHPKPISEAPLCGLPHPYQFPSKLKSLTLVATSLGWNSMSTLGLLENLEVLKLKENAFMGNTWTVVDGGFRQLEFLQIEEAAEFTFWEASPHHFPRLRGVVLKNCEMLLTIPLGLAEVASFHMLELHVCKSAAASAKKILEKKKKLADGSIFKFSIFPPTD